MDCTRRSFLLTAAAAPAKQATVWRVHELTFRAGREYAEPFSDVLLTCEFRGPGGRRFAVPGFYDGASAWLVRFAPDAPGRWSWRTSSNQPADKGFEGLSGEIRVRSAEGTNPLYRHGGFLKVAPGGRYLTYTDGTPFFWLSDTWWFCPSVLMPMEGSSQPGNPSTYRTLIDLRKRQRFSVVHMAFLGPMQQSSGTSSFQEQMRSRRLDVGYWKTVDRYMRYANEAGIIPVIGLAFHSGMDKNPVEDWKFLWRYAVARLGAYGVTWLICGEYNLGQGDTEGRVAKALELGAFIKSLDPYARAMTVHPWWHGGDKRHAWDQSWYDFIMFQGGHPGHGKVPPAQLYLDAWRRAAPKPVLEGECNYDGIHAGKEGREVMPEDVRRSAYNAIQAGSFGYTYGAHGLWYPTQNSDDKTFSDWGTPVPWWESMERPGARQMKVLRDIYESVEWWKLEPRPDAADPADLLVKAFRDEVFVVYFPPGVAAPHASLRLSAAAGGRFAAAWRSPRDGIEQAAGAIEAREGRLALPAPADSNDWILILRKLG